MPPNIFRPFATSKVGNITALAHRLRMCWRDIRPENGVLRAEGNGPSITSTTVRGFGLLLQYTFDLIVLDRTAGKRPQTWNMKSTLTIPSLEADMLGFQIVPGSWDLFLPDFVLDISAGFSPIRAAMSQLDVNRDVQDTYANFSHSSRHFYGFSDLIGRWDLSCRYRGLLSYKSSLRILIFTIVQRIGRKASWCIARACWKSERRLIISLSRLNGCLTGSNTWEGPIPGFNALLGNMKW